MTKIIAVQGEDRILLVQQSAVQGRPGPAGSGIIPGGTTGQVLAKASDDDYDATWVTASGTGIGTGGVTSVGLLAPSGLVVSGSPITASGAFTIAYASGIQAFSSAEAAKLSGVASGATANDGTVTNIGLIMPSGLVASGGPVTTSGSIVISYASGIQAFSSAEATKLAGIASGATANNGTVTNVGLIVPSGLVVSGSPITSSGTLALAYASGVQAFTTAESDKLAGIASGATTNSGTVTNVGLTMPSGLVASGSPVTSSGTIAITYASGIQAYTAAEATKLANVASGATANDGTVTSVSLQVPSGMTVSGGPVTASGSLAIAYASGIQAYTTEEATKLDDIDPGAQVNVGTNLTYSGDTRTINSSTGSGTTLPLVTPSGAGLSPATSFSTITYASGITLDFAVLDGQYRTISLSGDVSFTTSGIATGRATVLRLLPGASERTLTFPSGWVFVSAKPATLPANKSAVLSLTAFGSADTDCLVAYAAQP